jgi:hypothetical protein
MTTSFAFITLKFDFRQTALSLTSTFEKLLVIKPYLIGICYNNLPIGLYIILTTLYLMSKCFPTTIPIYDHMIIEAERSISNPNEYSECLMCNEIPNPQRVNALKANATSYDSIPFDPTDPVIVSKTEAYCCTECYTRGVVTQEDALDALWNRTIFYK